MLNLNAKTTALVLIDLQHYILDRPLAPHPAETVVKHAVRLMQMVRAGGGFIVLMRVAFSDGYADRLQAPVDLPQKAPEGGIPGAALAFHPEVEGTGGDLIITKRQWGAFHGTELDLQLRRRGITTLILGGVATNFGVESTVREAWQHNYTVLVAEDACTSMEEGMHRFAIEKILPRLARVRSTAQILEELT